MDQVNINDITDIKELKSIMADKFMQREQAQATVVACNADLQMIDDRLRELSSQADKQPGTEDA